MKSAIRKEEIKQGVKNFGGWDIAGGSQILPHWEGDIWAKDLKEVKEVTKQLSVEYIYTHTYTCTYTYIYVFFFA